MGPLRWALKKFGSLPSSFNQLISVSAQYGRAIAKWIEKLVNALKIGFSAFKFQDFFVFSAFTKCLRNMMTVKF